MADRFIGRRALVTGAASGIGAAAVRILIADGCHAVVGVDRNAALLQEMGKQLGESFIPCLADLADEASLDGIVANAVDRCGGLDVLINCAGIGSWGAAGQVDPQAWRMVMTINLDAVFRLSRAAIPALTQSRGCIVNVASISGMRADADGAAYGTAKAAVVALTRSMAVDYGPVGIRVNAISPGVTDTPIIAGMPPAMREAYARRIPLRRTGTPEDIAEAICFLASDSARYISGQNIAVDGGFTAASHAPDAMDFIGKS